MELRTKLQERRNDAALPPDGILSLPFAIRQKSRFRAVLAGGGDAAVTLPRGEILRGGDLLVSVDGRIVAIEASCERVLHVECATHAALVRAAYHLGNRHVPVEVGDGYLRIEADHVLEQMLVGLGAQVKVMQVPFEPEPGAYGGGHTHGEERGPGPKIHEFGTPRT